MEELVWQRLRELVVGQFRLQAGSPHDAEHWERVESYGLYVGRKSGADLEVVRLFAWLHDSQREEEGSDPEHGPRAAEYARGLCGTAFLLEPERLDVLTTALRHHAGGSTSRHPTIGACWDADRLDLDRVGVAPRPEFLSTETARILAARLPWQRRQEVRSARGW